MRAAHWWQWVVMTSTSVGMGVVEGGPPRPNLVVALVDDLGYNDAWAETSDLKEAWPNVRSLGGVWVPAFYTTWLCTPTRTAFLTGRYPWRSGLHHGVIADYQDLALPLNATTLAEKLNSVGYESHHVGKWHLGTYAASALPTRRGFQSSVGYLNGEIDHFTHDVDGLLDFYNMTGFGDSTKNGTYATHIFAEHAIQIVHTTGGGERPVFLYYALQNTHLPVEPPSSREVRGSSCINKGCDANYPNSVRSDFCGMALAADVAIGNLTRAIQTTWGWNTTLFVLAGDNGGAVAGGGNNWPLRGQKSEPWEGGLRNHLILKGLDLPDRGLYDPYTLGFVHVVDLHATLLNIAVVGSLANGSSWPALDGIDVYAALRDNATSPRQEAALMYDPCPRTNNGGCNHSSFAYRWRAWKLVKPGHLNDTVYPTPPSSTNASIECATGSTQSASRLLPGRFGNMVPAADPSPFVDDAGLNTLYLYNLDTDPTESIDLSAQHPSLVSLLSTKLHAAIQDEMPPCNVPSGSCYDDDPDGKAQCESDGFWSPWVQD